MGSVSMGIIKAFAQSTYAFTFNISELKGKLVVLPNISMFKLSVFHPVCASRQASKLLPSLALSEVPGCVGLFIIALCCHQIMRTFTSWIRTRLFYESKIEKAQIWPVYQVWGSAVLCCESEGLILAEPIILEFTVYRTTELSNEPVLNLTLSETQKPLLFKI